MAALAVGFAAMSPMQMLTGAIGIGAAAYSMFGQNKSSGNNGKLSDLKVSCSTYGKTIPMSWGTMRCSGNMIWSTDLVERKRYISAKGKDKTGKKKDSKKGNETYEYFANFAVALCTGPKEDVLRIWCDSNLIYDKLNPGNDDLVQPGFSQSDGGGGKTGMGSKKGANTSSGRWNWRFYPGSEDQGQDPFMVAKQGKDNVPAFRGVCYLMFEDFPLMDFGNRIPNVTAEVVDVKTRQMRTEKWNYNPDDEMPVALSNYTGDAWVDQTRLRAYERRGPGGFSNQLAVFDIQTGKEIRRYWLDEGVIVGISAEGDIVARGDGPATNSQPIHTHDPNSGATKTKWGVNSRSLGVSQDDAGNWHVEVAQDCVTFGKVDPLTSAVSWHTAIRTIFSSYMIMTDGLPDYGSNYSVGSTHIVAAPPTLGGGFFAIAGNKVYRIGNKTMTLADVVTSTGSSETETPPQLMLTMANPDDGQISIYPPIFSLGANNFIVPYRINNGTQQGFYVAVYDEEFKNRMWSYKLSTDTFAGATYDPIPAVVGDKWAIMTRGSIFLINAKTLSVESFFVPDIEGTDRQFYLSNVNALLCLGWRPPGYSGGLGWYILYFDKYVQGSVALSKIVTDLCLAVGLENDQIDVTQLEDKTITGYILEDATAAKSAISVLSQVYQFDLVESDGTIKFVTRGKNPIVTIPQEDLGVVGSDDSGDHYVGVRTQEVDLPRTVVVSHINPAKDYEVSTQHSRRPTSPMSVMHSKETANVSLPIAMTGDVAKQMAENLVYSAWAERQGRQYVLPWKYLKYDPTDVMQVQLDDGTVFNDRIVQFDVGADYSIQLSTVQQNATTYQSEAKGSTSGGVVVIGDKNQTIAVPFVADVPFVSDDDAADNPYQHQLYWGAAPYGKGFKGGQLQIKDPPGEYENKGGTLDQLVWGTVVNKLPAPPYGAEATDDQNKLVLAQAMDYEGDEVYLWEGVPPEEWPSTSNVILVGEELILFRDVDVNTVTGQVTLSHLIRGYRGTEWACGTHYAGERWAIMDTEGNKVATMTQENVGESVIAKLATPSLLQYLAGQETLVYKARNLRPWAPGDIRRSDGGSGATITWKRRTRFNGAMKNGDGSVPLNEGSERYRIFISANPVDVTKFDPGDATQYKRMAEVTAGTWTYSAVNMTTDGVTALSTIHGVVYQMSDHIGYGFPAPFSLQTTVATYKS